MVRLSCGIESTEDLLADLEQALATGVKRFLDFQLAGVCTVMLRQLLDLCQWVVV